MGAQGKQLAMLKGASQWAAFSKSRLTKKNLERASSETPGSKIPAPPYNVAATHTISLLMLCHLSCRSSHYLHLLQTKQC